MPERLTAGVARTDITPPPGIAHASWGAQTHERAAGVDLPLSATALALRTDETAAIIVDVDVVFVWQSKYVRRARERIAGLTGVPASNVRISYTHTHSGPVVNEDSWIDSGSEMVKPYLRRLTDSIVGVAWKAHREGTPARITAGTGTSTIAVNRRFERPEDGTVVVGRNWEGPVDHEVQVLRIDTTDGDPLAAVANYACHPITVGPDNDRITPDYPGVVKRVVEADTGATCLFLQGATGDVGPIHGVARNGIEEYRPLGKRLGHEVSRVYWEVESRERSERYVDTLPSGAPLAVYEYEYAEPERRLRVGTREMVLPVRDLPSLESLDAEYAERMERLQELRERGGDEAEIGTLAMQCRRIELRKGVVRSYGGQADVSFELQAIAVGPDIALVGMPGEPFVETGQRVKRESPFERTLFSGYTNEGWGYIPTADAYPEGGYEVEISPFSPGAAETVVDESLALLRELHPDT